jgi:hypothetical protein
MDWNCIAMLIRASRMSPSANQRFPGRDRAMSARAVVTIPSVRTVCADPASSFVPPACLA